MKTSETKDPTFVSILGRAFAIMEQLLISETPRSLAQLSRDTGIPKANAFRIIKTLEELGAVAADGDGYVLGDKMIELGSGAKRNSDFITLAVPYMHRLTEKYGETTNLGILFKESILIVHTEPAEQRYIEISLPTVVPLHCSSMGKQFLARRSDEQIAKYFAETELRARTVGTIMSPERFFEEQQDILTDGISHDREEYEYGLSCMAAPVFLKGELAAGLSLSGPTSRLYFKGFSDLEAAVKEAAAAISEELTRNGVSLPDIG